MLKCASQRNDLIRRYNANKRRDDKYASRLAIVYVRSRALYPGSSPINLILSSICFAPRKSELTCNAGHAFVGNIGSFTVLTRFTSTIFCCCDCRRYVRHMHIAIRWGERREMEEMIFFFY